ncbi:N-acetylneuraminate synthase [Pseudoalteromonas piscicida]|uniref:N-acetylneuraminate synthase n=1 Tax=Pseudoalteromonas TaxID=53246 RepID=UPI0015716A14|nr:MULTISPECIES: N-acetylneuraminate synthase [Pseudoalteromonas]MCG7552483.1 N-acetylneuraminate synthase [Pseudoalteromonas sp. Of11M-6]NSY32138.1 N-acetylneuraminate synthase [Pseudoalteromonas sp. JC28]UDM62205.1 N-acetylneuraminate synthase [Pseudoalteromonas piscicida]
MIKPNRVTVIAEIGVNHNGDISLAKKLIDVAVEAGADVAKFQSFVTEEELVVDTPKAGYQKKTTDGDESQFDMIKRLELSRQDHEELLSYCQCKNITFMSSAFDLVSIDLLIELGMTTFKIPSGEITNTPYLRKIGHRNANVILSTGMADLREVEFAFNTLVKSGTEKENITILHCTSEYPASMESVNLLAMSELGDNFGTEYGYSDHTQGAEVAIAAVALGASVIEKHITLDKKMAGPDHEASMEPKEFIAMVKAIRNIETALGSKVKTLSSVELENKRVVRKRIVAKCEIKRGDVFSMSNLTTKRTSSGVDAQFWDELIGKVATKNYYYDQSIEREE